MSTCINKLTHTLRSVLANDGILLGLGHTHQLIAAVLGYKSLAARQASGETEELDRSLYWLADVGQLRARAESLDLEIDVVRFLAGLQCTSDRLGGPRVFDTPEDLQEEVGLTAQDVIADDDRVGSRMAETNCTGPFRPYLEVAEVLADPLPLIGEDIVLEFVGNVQGEHDMERGFFGDTVDVEVEARLTMYGRRLAGTPAIKVTSAELDWSWANGGNDEPPLLTKVEALASELDISLEQAGALVDAEILPGETSAGVPNGYLVDLSYCEPSEVVTQLRALHNTGQIRVTGTSIARIRPGFRD